MKGFEPELGRRLNQVRDEHDAASGANLWEARREAFRRVRRRRAAKGAGAAVAALGIAAGAFTLPGRLSPADGSIPAHVAAPPAVQPSQGEEHLGFWPTLTEDDARDLCDALDLRTAQGVANNFVSEALGWSNLRLLDSGKDGPDTRTVAFDRVGRSFGAVSPVAPIDGGELPEHPGVDVEATRLADSCWWVTGIASREDGDVSATVDGDVVNVGFDLPHGAVSADVIVVEKGAAMRTFVTGDAGATSAEVEDFQGPGYAVVLWKSVDGWVITAEGVTIP